MWSQLIQHYVVSANITWSTIIVNVIWANRIVITGQSADDCFLRLAVPSSPQYAKFYLKLKFMLLFRCALQPTSVVKRFLMQKI